MTISPHYAEVEKAIQKRTHSSIEEAQAKIKTSIDRQQRELDVLFTRTREFLTLGVANVDYRQDEQIYVSVHGHGWGYHNFSWKQYFRKLAKEHRRPFVRYTSYNYGWPRDNHAVRFLELPKRRYMDPLICTFLLAPDEVVSKYSNTVDWDFRFRGAAGAEIFDTWLAECRTNPDYRKTLRVQ